MHTTPTEVTPAQARKVVRDIEAAIKNIAMLGEADSVKSLQLGVVSFAVQRAVQDLTAELSALTDGNWHQGVALPMGQGTQYTRLWRPEPMDTATYKALKDLLREAKDENIRIGALYRAERMRCAREQY